jgi:uroporphyrinogen-III synthase
MPSIILTRSLEDNLQTAPLFEERGFTVHSAPMIELRPVARDVWMVRAAKQITRRESVLLTSVHATEIWLEMRKQEFRGIEPQGYYVVGETSARMLRAADPAVPVRAVASSGEELLNAGFDGVTGMIYPCSARRRGALVDALRRHGIKIIELPLYMPDRPESSHQVLRQALDDARKAPPVILAFFSISAVENFFSLPVDIPEGAIFAAIGKTTAEALRERGVSAVVLPDAPSAEALADALVRVAGS